MLRLGTGLGGALLAGCALYEGPSAPPPCTPEVEVFRVASMDAIANGAQATASGLDLDGDGRVENLYGQVAASLAQAFGIQADDTQARFDRRVAATGWRVELDTCPDAVTVTLPGGAPVGLVLDFADAGDTELAPAAPAAAVLDADRRGARVAAALSPGYDVAAAEGILPYLQLLIDTQPGAAATLGLDPDSDGVETLDELETMSVWRDLMAPDLDTDGDGENESMSFGYHVRFE